MYEIQNLKPKQQMRKDVKNIVRDKKISKTNISLTENLKECRRKRKCQDKSIQLNKLPAKRHSDA